MGVGLDIGSKTIKIVELINEKGKSRLRASGVVAHNSQTPEHLKDDKEFTNLATSIRKLFKEAKISSKNVAIALPETQVYTRTIRFPLLSDEEVSSAVRWEAEQYVPIPVNEAILQHQIVERREDTSPPSVSVLLVAAPKALVEKYSRVIEMSGLSVVIVETELLSLVRSLAPDDQTVIIVDFGAKSTDIAIAKNSQLILSRSIPTAGEAFTRAISQALGIDESQAEEYKRTYGLSTTQLEGKIKNALDPIFRLVADEIKKAIHYYESTEKGELPKSVILSGGSASMPEVASALTKMINLEVVVGNPFSKIEVDPEAVKTLSGFASFYAISVGLALREE